MMLLMLLVCLATISCNFHINGDVANKAGHLFPEDKYHRQIRDLLLVILMILMILLLLLVLLAMYIISYMDDWRCC